MKHSEIRTDIQALRALAVTAVVIYHTGLDFLPGGYLGVDVFFVISGFLIGKVIMSSCDRGDFSFSEFYIRRIFRLVPATLSTLLFTTAFAALLLTYSDWVDFKNQLLGALTFTANFVMMFQSDYFAPAAERMPLLHMWSLAVEEQFYLFAPIIIFLTPRNWRTFIFVSFGLLSLFACFTLIFGWIDLPISSKRSQSIAFYMLPTRAWEMIFGCFGAWLMLKSPQLHIPALVKWCALIGVIGLLVAPIGTSHPAQDALLVTIFTLLLLLGRDNWLPNSIAIRTARKIGDWSYSIYLVHWPLFAFANNIFIENTPSWVSIALVFTSIGLGALQYAYVETPFRYGWKAQKSRALIGLITCIAVVALFSLPTMTNVLHPEYGRFSTAPPNVGLSSLCDQRGGEFIDFAECSTVVQPRVALLGDSIAMQWSTALAERSTEFGGLVQITKSACAPALGVAQVHGRYTQGWATECINFVEDSLEWIIESESIEIVVISSGYVQVLMAQGQSILSDGELREAGQGLGLAASRRTMERLAGAGKSVVLIGTPAITGVDFGTCQARRLTGLLTVGAENCTFNLEDFRENFSPLLSGLEQLGGMEAVTLVWPHEAYCDQSTCQTILSGTVLYRDRLHLTVDGTRMIAEDLGLVEMLMRN